MNHLQGTFKVTFNLLQTMSTLSPRESFILIISLSAAFLLSFCTHCI